MADFVIDGCSYSSGVLDGSVQMKVMKRLLPIFTAIIGQVSAIEAASKQNEEERRNIEDAGPALDTGSVEAIKRQMSDRMAAAVMPVSREIAALSDADEDFIVHSCFAVTQWRDEKGIYPIREPDGRFGHQRNSSVVVRARVSMHVLAETFTDLFKDYGIDIQKLMTDAGARR